MSPVVLCRDTDRSSIAPLRACRPSAVERRSHREGKSRSTPSTMMMPPEIACHTCGGTPSSAVVALSSRVKATTLTASDAAMTYGRQRARRASPPCTIAPPTTMGSSGSTHGAATVSTPAARLRTREAVTGSRHRRDERRDRRFVVEHAARDQLATVVDEHDGGLQRDAVLLAQIRAAVVVDLEHREAVGRPRCAELFVELAALRAPRRVEEQHLRARGRLDRPVGVV